MKKLGFFVLVLILGAMFNGCQKDEFVDSETTGMGILKSASTFDLPLYMDQTTLVGYAEITHDPVANDIMVTAYLPDLDPMWTPTCAHLYAGATEPVSSSPGLFPFKDCDWTDGFSFIIEDVPTWDYCEELKWFFALHIEFMREYIDEATGLPAVEKETAWLLPEGGGMNWYNKNGKTTGWGQYFPWTFDYTPEIADITLESDPGMFVDPDWLPSGVWTDVPEFPAFEMCLAGAGNPFYFFDVDAMDVSVPLEEDVMNEFFLGKVDDPDFWAYWDGKGVNETAAPGTWQALMWLILKGDAPMFYLVWDGIQYDLIDGLQYAVGQAMDPSVDVLNPLRISGDYPAGTYSFTGSVAGEYCTSEDFTISLTVAPCPAP